MSLSAETALYYAWHIERAQLPAHTLQILAVFFLFALWWHGNSGWRWSRWPVIIYFAGLGIIRYAIWVFFAAVYEIRSPIVAAFIFRTGAIGLVLTALIVVFLIMDNRRRWVRFDDFSPETFRANGVSAGQWFGLIAALIALWSPFVPHPGGGGSSLFAWGITTSFGITLTPSVLMLAGLMLAGRRTGNKTAAIFFGLITAASSVGTDPLTVHGGVAAALGLVIAYMGFRRVRTTEGRGKIANGESLVQ